MKTSAYFTLTLLFLVLFLYACSAAEEEPASTQDPGPVTKGPEGEVKNAPSCDDNNVCTEDKYNEQTGQCENKKLNVCCGDSVCDVSERCDPSIHTTVCPGDCTRNCPAYLIVSPVECVGACFKTEDYYIVDGPTTFSFKLENQGELSATNINSGFNCLKDSSGVKFMDERDNDVRDGVSIIGVFDNEEETITLTGKTYLKSSTTYTLKITGEPTRDNDLTCSVRFSASEFYYGNDIKIRLRTRQG